MDRETFRRDRWLRTSGYHLVTWSLAAFVLEARAQAAGDGGTAAVLPVLVAGAFLSSLTHERRVGKMAGPAGEAVFTGAGRMWALLFLLLVAASVVAVAGARPQWLFPLWMLGVGAGFAAWGRRVAFGWYVGLGVAMAAVAALDVALVAAGGPFAPLRLAVLGLALPAAGLATNRRYLWFRVRAAG